jgi:3,4-dihydroxy 2-butanone 4-phosphate synthase/GTP cyclohydrolase II
MGLNAHAYAYETPFDPLQQVALVIGEVEGKERVPCRIYREQPLADLVNAAAGNESLMAKAVAEIKARGRSGVLLLVRSAHAVEPLVDGKNAPQPFTGGPRGEKHGSALKRETEWREVGVGAQILRDLGVRSVALMTTAERQYVGLGGFDIEIAETILLK